MVLKRVSVALLLVFLGACGVPDSELAAKVNGKGIVKKEFEAQVERNLARYRSQGHDLPPGTEARIRESVLRRMIDEAVIEQKAESQGIRITAEELEAKFKEHKDRFRTPEAFDDYLKRSGNTVENMKDDLRRNLLRDRVVEKLSGTVEVLDDEVAKYYQDNVERFTEKEQVRASRIFVRVPPNATAAEKKAAKREADAALAALKKGGDFAAVARQKSKGPEAEKGGDLGWIVRGRMGPEFDKVAFELAPNVVSPVVETSLGYEIIKVAEEKAEYKRPLDEVKESIKNSLLARKRNEKRRDVLRALKGDAKVEQLVKFEMPAPAMPAPPGTVAPPATGALPPGHPGAPEGVTPVAPAEQAGARPVPPQPAPTPKSEVQ